MSTSDGGILGFLRFQSHDIDKGRAVIQLDGSCWPYLLNQVRGPPSWASTCPPCALPYTGMKLHKHTCCQMMLEEVGLLDPTKDLTGGGMGCSTAGTFLRWLLH